MRFKRYKYSLPMMALAIAAMLVGYFLEITWLYSVTAGIFGFLIGFFVAVDKLYKKATGDHISNDTLDYVLDELL